MNTAMASIEGKPHHRCASIARSVSTVVMMPTPSTRSPTAGASPHQAPRHANALAAAPPMMMRMHAAAVSTKRAPGERRIVAPMIASTPYSMTINAVTAGGSSRDRQMRPSQ